MKKTNLHSHTLYCDGKNSTEEIIIAAIKNNLSSIGISTHGPLPFGSDWNIKENQVEKYIKEVNELKIKYKNKIDVFLGMEIDYLPEIGFTDYCISLINKLDYYIGSVHFVGTFKNGVKWTVDYNIDEFNLGIVDSFNGDVKLAIESYYKYIGDMAIKYNPPVIGHIDLIKKNNKNNAIFVENEDWYLESVTKCLDKIKTTSSKIEVNTGGMARGYTNEQYPSNLILKLIKEKDIPITISSDAHSVDRIDYKYQEMYELLKSLKFKEVWVFTKQGWEKEFL